MTDDVDRIMAIMTTAFDPAYGEAWNRRQLEDALVMANSHYLLISSDGTAPSPGMAAAGFSLSRYGYREEELLLFAVAPEYRRRGLGRILLGRFAAAAKSRGAERLLLEMRRGNSAEVLYRNIGFLPIGQRTNYYRAADGTRLDAVTFACDLFPG